MIQYKGVNHTALATSDMDMTIRFWRDLLGMRLVAGIGESGGRQYFFEITEHSFIGFFEWKDVEPVEDKDAGRPVKGPFVFDHICIELADEDELWKLKDKLEAADVWVTEVMDNGFIHSFFSTDPNNIQLEFCYRVKGENIARNPKMLDPRPSAVTREGTDPVAGKWPAVAMPTRREDRKIYPGVLKDVKTTG